MFEVENKLRARFDRNVRIWMSKNHWCKKHASARGFNFPPVHLAAYYGCLPVRAILNTGCQRFACFSNILLPSKLAFGRRFGTY